MKILRILENEYDALSLLKDVSFMEKYKFSIRDITLYKKRTCYFITSEYGKSAYIRYAQKLQITRDKEKSISLRGMTEDNFGKLCNKYWGKP